MAEITKDTTANTIGTGTGGLELDPSGTEVVTINNGVRVPDGTKTEPAIRMSDDNNTGIYSPANEVMAITGNGEDVLRTNGVASAVNYVDVTNSATGADLVISASGTDADIDLDIQSKGTGKVLINGVEAEPADATILKDADIGVNVQAYDANILTIQNFLSATFDPGTTGDESGYSIGSRWINLFTGIEYVCVDSSTFAGVWKETTGSGLTTVLASDVDAEASLDGYVLTSDGAGNAAWEVVAGGFTSPLTTKGDLFTYDTADQRLAVGTDGQVLTADAAEATGVKWANAAGGGATVLSDLTDVSGTDAAVGHQYWRIVITAIPAGSWMCRVHEIEFRSTTGGSDLTGSGIAAANTEFGINTASAAFDDDLVTHWADANPFVPGSWISYDFGSATVIKEFSTYISASNNFMEDFTIEYSDDNSNWTVASTITGNTSVGSEWKDFTIPSPGASINQVLSFNGTNWENSDIPRTLPSLNDVFTEMVPTDGQVLTFDTTNGWQSETAAGGNWLSGNGGANYSTSPTSNSNSVALGNNAFTSGNGHGIAIGTNTVASSSQIAIGNGTQATNINGDGIAMGRNALSASRGGIAIGFLSDAGTASSSDWAVAIGGTGAQALNTNSIAFGSNAVASANEAVSIGNTVTNSVASSFRAGASTTNILHLKDLGRLHLEGAQAAYIAPSYATTAEPVAIAGAIIYDSTLNKLKLYNGTSWETITSS